jgi:alpha-glucosidase (family GH31 glycosyl hydrolase)
VAWNNLGNVLQALGRYSGAEDSYRRTLQLVPDFPYAHNNLGGVLNAIGRLAEAEESFRRAVELKYALMPYVFAQAKESSAHGWPILRTLFYEFPGDPTSWEIEDEYFFGSDLLVSPLF